MPAAEAVIVVMPDVPPILSTPVAPCVTPPVPDNAVLAVIVPLLVSVFVVTVSKVLDVNVPLFV